MGIRYQLSIEFESDDAELAHLYFARIANAVHEIFPPRKVQLTSIDLFNRTDVPDHIIESIKHK